LKNKLWIAQKVSEKRFNRKLVSKFKKRQKRREELADIIAKSGNTLKKLESEFGGEITYLSIVENWLPTNLSYLVNSEKSDFYFDFRKIQIKRRKREIIFRVPEVFSLIDNPKESYQFVKSIVFSLLCEQFEIMSLDYQSCRQLNISAQVFLDIILSEVISFYDRCSKHEIVVKKLKVIKRRIRLANLLKTSEDIKKILFSVGSPASLRNERISYSDIIPYRLCAHSREGSLERVKASKQQQIDTTTLADYVIDSLGKMNRILSNERREDLCRIIGEVLINAEEHSTTKHRFSIGYFKDERKDGKHIGLFRLVIMNFGQTIYEKFSDSNCPNKYVVEKMKKLSDKYTKKGWIMGKDFEEETLWTLYALQEGVTSVADRKRGNGSIQFIDSFFNIKGEPNSKDEESRMTILSGNTNITFDGTYRIKEKDLSGEKFKVMTFNDSGNIEEKPDKKYVKFVENYFPGTIISAKIYFNEDDLIYDADQR
jgi:hypothetical protein